MTNEDLKQELDRDPFVPLRVHLASGKTLDIEHPDSAFLRQNTMLVVHRLRPGTHEIGNYDVAALRLIERVETLEEAGSR